MKNYFWLIWKDNPDIPSAYSNCEDIHNKSDRELITEVEDKRILPFDLKLKRITENANGITISEDLSGLKTIWMDYQHNEFLWPFCSEKLYSIIQTHLTGKEGINWIQAIVKHENEQRIYYIPRFEKKLDVLDTNRTMFVKGTDAIIKPYYSLEKIKDYSMFGKPLSANFWKITCAIYVSEAIKKAIQKEKLTGIEFNKALVTAKNEAEFITSQ